MDIQRYIDSGILEAYLTGAATPAETQEVLYLKQKYPEVNDALLRIELDLENMAHHMAIPPPPTAWLKIEQEIDGLIAREKSEPRPYQAPEEPKYKSSSNNGHQFIEVEAESSHMRIHKAWRWIFAAVFVLGKVFLACAIYYYLENRQMQQQMQDMRQELKQLKR